MSEPGIVRDLPGLIQVFFNVCLFHPHHFREIEFLKKETAQRRALEESEASHKEQAEKLQEQVVEEDQVKTEGAMRGVCVHVGERVGGHSAPVICGLSNRAGCLSLDPDCTTLSSCR